jgi:hypothetical protein
VLHVVPESFPHKSIQISEIAVSILAISPLSFLNQTYGLTGYLRSVIVNLSGRLLTKCHKNITVILKEARYLCRKM